MYKNLVAALAAACCFLPAHAQPREPLKVGFVYVAPVSDAGWVHQHEEGRKAVDAAFGDRVKTTFVENVAEGPDAERVIRDLAATGHKLIFTPSFGYMEPTLKVAKDFPQVKFESITGYKMAPNVATASLPFSCAAAITAVDAVWKATTSASWLNKVFAASRSLAGSNQVLSQISFTTAFGATERRPSVKALMPCRTSGIGKPAT